MTASRPLLDAESTARTIDVGGIETHYHDAGEGPPLLLLHGSGPGVSAWSNWRVVYEALSRGRRVLAPDQVGFGRTGTDPSGAYGRAVWTRHALGFLDALGIERCDVIGNSMGGAVALSVAAARPQALRRIVLMGSVGVKMELPTGLDQVWGYQPGRAAMRDLIRLFAYDDSIATDDLVELRHAASVEPGAHAAFAAMFPPPRQRWLDDLALSDDELARIDHPVALVHGFDDEVIPFEHSAIPLMRALPGADLYGFGRCGHWTMIERPQTFLQVVEPFLDAAAVAFVKAVLFSEHGGPEVLSYADVADPRPGPGEVLLEVGAVTVNYGPDTMVRSGTFRVPVALPHISGSDPAGTVVAVGAGVDAALVGRRFVVAGVIACGVCDFCARGCGENLCRDRELLGVHRWGGRAELVAVPATNIVELPDTVADDKAAALSMAYLTTYHGIVRRAQIGPADTLLVAGAGGGMGVAAIQLAKDIGARVIATTTAAGKVEPLRRLGADLVLDATEDGWPEHVRAATGGRGVSVLFDNVGPVSWRRTLPLLDRAGRFVCSGGTTGSEITLDVMALYRNQITMHFYANGSSADLRDLVALTAAGRIDPVVDSRFPLSAAARAEERLVAREQIGNVVLIPDHRFPASTADRN